MRLDSPLRAVMIPEGYNYDDEKIKEAVLQQIPLGATSQQIRAFLSLHFIDTAYSVETSAPKGAHYQPKEPHIFVRAIDIANSAGGETVEIYLLLNSNESLEDVVVKSHRAYL